MKTRPLLMNIAIAMVLAFLSPDVTQAQLSRPLPLVPTATLSPAVWQRAIVQLRSDNYHIRQDATELLYDAGPDAVPDLVQTCLHGEPETSFRAMEILERLYVKSLMLQDEDAIEAIEVGMDQITVAGKPLLADKIQYIYDQNSIVAERALIRKIKSLGGIIVYATNVTRRVPFENRTTEHVGVDVVIGEDWIGGETGLKNLYHLGSLRRLYLVNGAPVSRSALEEVQAYQPSVEIADRPRSRLGVEGMSGLDECRITGVAPGSAAAKAGIRPNDIIFAFGNEPIRTFDSLVQTIQKFQPGDQVPVRVYRDNQEQRLTVTLEGWTQD